MLDMMSSMICIDWSLSFSLCLYSNLMLTSIKIYRSRLKPYFFCFILYLIEDLNLGSTRYVLTKFRDIPKEAFLNCLIPAPWLRAKQSCFIWKWSTTKFHLVYENIMTQPNLMIFQKNEKPIKFSINIF